MKTMNRREALGALSAFALMAQATTNNANAQTAEPEVKFFKYAEVPLTHGANGTTGRNIPQDLIPAGDVGGVHLTTLDAGKEYGPMRKGTLCEIRVVFSGKMEVMPEGKPSEMCGPGDMIVSPAGSTYHVRNPGDTPLTYFILQIKPKA